MGFATKYELLRTAGGKRTVTRMAAQGLKLMSLLTSATFEIDCKCLASERSLSHTLHCLTSRRIELETPTLSCAL